jgi:hypothetical protein
MSNTVERIIIRNALDHPGLLTRKELAFVRDIAKLPSEKRLTQGQMNWLYQIGRDRLNLGYPTPQPDPVIDLKSRAYL